MQLQRLTLFLGIFTALVLGILLVGVGGDTSSVYESNAYVAGVSVLPEAAPQHPSATSTVSATATTSVRTRPVTIPPRASETTAAAAAAVVPEPGQDVGVLNAALQASAETLRSALVNIICYAPAGGRLRSISGSGVIIDPKGLILTNAHIAQHFLLADQGVSCVVRGGSPATDEYRAAPVFISPAWIHANASLITNPAPSGTGEYDFALIGITRSATAAPLPSAFPFIPLATDPPLAGTPVVIASFGAQFLSTSLVQSGLFPTVVFGSVKKVLTFSKHTIDVLALGGSVAAQEGSSGGGVANASGALVGTIMTSTVEGATAERELNALSASYIRADYASETGMPLDFLLAKPVADSVTAFKSDAAALESILLTVLGN